MGVLSDLFGKKPKIPSLPKISPGDVQAEYIAENTRNIPGAEALVSGATEANARQITKALEMAVPGALQQLRKNILAQSFGQIPQDVSSELQRLGAAQGYGLGVMGPVGTLGGNITPRNLGLTSLDLMQQGQANYQALAQPYLGASVPIENTWFSPEQRLNFAVGERNAAFERDLLRAQVKAAPDPATRGIFDTTMTLLSMAISAYTGSSVNYDSSNIAGGGGGGGGGGGPQWDTGAEDTMGGWRASFGNTGRFGFGRVAASAREGLNWGGWYLGRQPGPG